MKTIFENKEDINFISSFSYDNVSNTELDINFVKNKLLIILKKRFSEYHKHDILTYDNRLAISCPYCGDSSDNINKKRGNLYYDTLEYHCYNCNYHTNITKLFSDFLDDFNKSDILYVNSFKKITYSKTTHNLLDFDMINNIGIDKNLLELEMKFNLNKKALKYLKDRHQNDFDLYSYDKKDDSIIIYNINKSNNKVIGYVKRLLNNSNYKYISYDINKIYKILNLTENDDINKINKISLIFNILNVDLYKKITIFEGPFDANLFNNSIAISGVNKSFPFDGDNLRYFFDNDKPGMLQSMKLLKDGKYVFLWKKFLHDLKIDHVSLKDITDIFKYIKNNNLKVSIDFEKYFSNEKLDLYYL